MAMGPGRHDQMAALSLAVTTTPGVSIRSNKAVVALRDDGCPRSECRIRSQYSIVRRVDLTRYQPAVIFSRYIPFIV